MAESTEIEYLLTVDVEKCSTQIRQMEALLYRTIGLIRRLGLPEDIENAITRIQRLIMTVRIAHAAMIALHAASGPVGWALAGVGIVSAAWTAYDVATYEMGSK